MTVFVCLPCYNEALSLPPLLDEFARLKQTLPEPLRLIAVDDGSADSTRRVLDASAHAGDLSIRVVAHPQNRGLGPAILSGLKAALEEAAPDERNPQKQSNEARDTGGGGGDVIVCMDADNTHDPRYIPQMVQRIRAGADVVIASRYRGGSAEVGVPLFRRLLSHAARWVFRLCLPISGVRDYTCGYRAYRVALLREAMNVFGDQLIERRGFACTDEILVKLSSLTQRIEEIGFVLRYDKKRGRSSLPLLDTIRGTLKLLYHGRMLRARARRLVAQRPPRA